MESLDLMEILEISAIFLETRQVLKKWAIISADSVHSTDKESTRSILPKDVFVPARETVSKQKHWIFDDFNLTL